MVYPMPFYQEVKMKKKWLHILYYSTYLFVCLGFIGCHVNTKNKVADSSGADVSGSALSNSSSQTVSATEPIDISLGGHKPEQFVYDSVNNSLAMVTCRSRKYTLYSLENDDSTWKKEANWTCSKGELLDTFTYGADGSLYCCRKKYKKGKLKKQAFIKLKKNGTSQVIHLKKLGSAEIKDIQFSGTALALTFADNSVKFYNIAEKEALGSDSIRGQAGKNIFYNYHYITKKISSSDTAQLTDYDIRSGQADKSFPLEGDSEVSNYRENIYLLTSEGLYLGLYTDTILSKQADLEELQIPSVKKVIYFQGTRNHVLYYAWKDKESRIFLKKSSVSEKQNVDILTKI
jgi:hypothetical protein